MNRLLPPLAGLLAGLVSCAAPATAALPQPEAAAQASAPAQPAPGERLSRRELVRRVLPHNVRFVLYDGKRARRTASGVVIGSESGPDGAESFILTNAHAVETAGVKSARFAVLVEQRDEVTEHPATLVAVGSVPALDLALVKVKGLSLPPATLAEDSEVELGDDVVVAAAPFGRSISISGGMISHVEWDRASRQPAVLKTDAPIGYGASGGGIYSLSSGKLVAIVEGYRTAKVGFQVQDQPYSFDVPMPGETFAASTGKVRAFLQGKGFARLLQRAAASAGTASAALR